MRGLWRTPRTLSNAACAASTSLTSSWSSHACATITSGMPCSRVMPWSQRVSPSGSAGSHSAYTCTVATMFVWPISIDSYAARTNGESAPDRRNGGGPPAHRTAMDSSSVPDPTYAYVHRQFPVQPSIVPGFEELRKFPITKGAWLNPHRRSCRRRQERSRRLSTMLRAKRGKPPSQRSLVARRSDRAGSLRRASPRNSRSSPQ